MFGGNRCLGAEQYIYDPVQDESVRVDRINGDFHVYSWDSQQNKIVIACALKPFRKPPDQVLCVKLSNGNQVFCSPKHKILCQAGWKQVSDLTSEDRIMQPIFNDGNPVDSCNQPEKVLSGQQPFSRGSSQQPLLPYKSDAGLSGLSCGAPLNWQIAVNSQYDYSVCHHQCDGSPRHLLGICRDVVPLRIDVPRHTSSGSSCLNNPAYRAGHSPSRQVADHLSSLDSLTPGDSVRTVNAYHAFYKNEPQTGSVYQESGQFQHMFFGFQSDEQSSFRSRCIYDEDQVASPSVFPTGKSLISLTEKNLISRLSICEFCLVPPIAECGPGIQNNPIEASPSNISLKAIHVVSINTLRYDTIYDFTVPVYHNYLAGGIIHRNSGKSESNIGYDLCAYALGIHPWRKTRPKSTIWAVADSWPLVGKLLWQEKIRDYLPGLQIKRILWHNKSEEIPQEIRLRNGNRIEFKAGEQGRKAFEGRPIDAIYQDEQIKSDSEGINTEMEARLMDKPGFFAGSMTPIQPQPWLEERVINMPADDDVYYANLNDNRISRGGYILDEEIDRMISRWPAEVQETRIKGHFAAFMGAVYKTFNRQDHVCEPFKIPDDWDRYRAIDWGFNNPFACLWLARDKDRHWYVYNEHYEAQRTLAYHAEEIKRISGKERYRCTWADHDAQDRYEFRKLGIPTNPAKKDVHLGIEAVQGTLKIQGDGKSRLTIFNTCRNTIREMGGYRWAEGTEKRDAKDEPMKINDHCVDPLRYAIYAVEGKFFFSESDLS